MPLSLKSEGKEEVQTVLASFEDIAYRQDQKKPTGEVGYGFGSSSNYMYGRASGRYAGRLLSESSSHITPV
mgnify:CR=1